MSRCDLLHKMVQHKMMSLTLKCSILILISHHANSYVVKNSKSEEIQAVKQCYPSSQVLSDVMATFSVIKHWTHGDRTDSVCATYLFFPHFTFLFNDSMLSVTVKENTDFVQRRKRSLKTSYHTGMIERYSLR